MSALLEVTGLSYSVGTHNSDARLILNNISVSVEQATAAALIGPNGAGKTTLLRLIAGSLSPAAGTILFNGQPLDAFPPRQRARHRRRRSPAL